MKINLSVLFLFSSICLLFCKKSAAQEIRNDTIIVSTGEKVTITFPDSPNFEFVDEGDGSYEIEKLGKKSFLLKAAKKGVKSQRVKFKEDDRTHEFVLMYRDVAPKLKFEWVKRKDLKAYVEKKDRNADKKLEAANQLYDQGRFEEALTEYSWLVWEVNRSKEVFVNNRINETQTIIREAKENKYKQAMVNGETFAAEKKYNEAIGLFTEALSVKPGDTAAQSRLKIYNDLGFKYYTSKGQNAKELKDYQNAETYYSEARKLDSISFQRYYLKIYNEVLKNVQMQEKAEEKDGEYYTILANAKIMAAKAVTAQDYDRAIREYEKASASFPIRKFPKDRKKMLMKIKNNLSAKN